MTDILPPLPWKWDGDSLTPLNPHWARQADKHLTIGEVYTLVPHEDRSSKSHRFYFASVHDLWLSLPEHLSDAYPSAEHLRRRGSGHAGAVVVVLTAQSQSYRAMGRQVFGESTRAVLDYLSDLIVADPRDARQAAA